MLLFSIKRSLRGGLGLLPLFAALMMTACGGGAGGGGGGASSTDAGGPELIIETERGNIRIEMLTLQAPLTAQAIAGVVLTGGYDNNTFFDVRDGLFVQFGEADATLSEITPVAVEVTGEPLDFGNVAMGWVGAKSNSSNRLIFPLGPLDDRLAAHYSVFGRIIEGENILTQVVQGEGVIRVTTQLARPIFRMLTQKGGIVVEMDPEVAPNTTARIADLVCQGYYSGINFDRVEPLLIQTGLKSETGTGTTIAAELNNGRFLRGAVGLYHPGTDVDGGDSEIMIMKGTVREFDGNYTYFGSVLAGMEVVDQVGAGEPIIEVALQFDLDGRDCTANGGNAPENPPVVIGGG